MSEREEFMGVFDDLVEDVVNLLSKITDVTEEASNYIKEMMKYNVPNGKLNRGLTVVSTYLGIYPKATKEEKRKAQILGWCVEWLQAFLLVADDIMDQSLTRRGQPCWYRKVGSKALNDGFTLENCIYQLLDLHFGSLKCYPRLFKIFIDVSFKTELGQTLDLSSVDENDKPIYSKFSKEFYFNIVRLKTAHYSFYLPVALGVILGLDSLNKLDQLDSVLEEVCPSLIKMGEIFQVQDDYLDVYADPETLGKIGTDIQDGKCSWPFVTALEIATEEQKESLFKNYAKNDPQCIKKVKEIFKDLKITELFLAYEEKIFNEITEMINSIQSVDQQILNYLKSKIFKRKK
ncbi:farnesyl-pyrophosphate synthetase [Anaeramoeba flamelloides]|uniref:Farnesyl-pyrophosphate synthetase n=1 Tax=Anaeramoeba flamelloides TaxID=1746091 RepID=A0ABQ8YQY4_9EUKA|nr:farnesyl-pyrophosphate synthetase [Anaeramoeba flamelloides]